MLSLSWYVIFLVRGIGLRICVYFNLGKWDMKGDLGEGYFWKKFICF